MNDAYALSAAEKVQARRKGVALKALRQYSVAELMKILDVPAERAREVFALYDLQRVPGIGLKFAGDLISIGYYSLAGLTGKTGPELIHELELHCGYWQDPCVEDECRLAVHFARHGDTGRQWWHFTQERKAYRAVNGYPPDRPTKAWHEMLVPPLKQ